MKSQAGQTVIMAFSIDGHMKDKLAERKDAIGVPFSEQVRRALALYFYVLRSAESQWMDEIELLKNMGIKI